MDIAQIVYKLYNKPECFSSNLHSWGKLAVVEVVGGVIGDSDGRFEALKILKQSRLVEAPAEEFERWRKSITNPCPETEPSEVNCTENSLLSVWMHREFATDTEEYGEPLWGTYFCKFPHNFNAVPEKLISKKSSPHRFSVSKDTITTSYVA